MYRLTWNVPYDSSKSAYTDQTLRDLYTRICTVSVWKTQQMQQILPVHEIKRMKYHDKEFKILDLKESKSSNFKKVIISNKMP